MADAKEKPGVTGPATPFPELLFLGDALPFVDRIVAILDQIPLLEGFAQEEIVRMAPYLKIYRAPVGTEIICEGDTGDFMLLLISGRVEIFKRDTSGMPKHIGTAGPGKALGEMSMIDGAPRSASCIALEDTLFAVLDRPDLSRIITDDPRLGVKLLIELVQILARRLREANSRLVGAMEI
jgi:CRP-like cAMP-binding protein